MGGVKSIETFWNDPIQDIPEGGMGLNNSQLTMDVYHLMYQRKWDQLFTFEEMFDREFQQRGVSMDVAQRLMNSPLISDENKAWVQRRGGLEKVLRNYHDKKKIAFEKAYRKSSVVAVERLTQFYARQIMYENMETFCRIDALEECTLVTGPVWRQKRLNEHQKREVLKHAEMSYDLISYQIHNHLVNYLRRDLDTEILKILTQNEDRKEDYVPSDQEIWQITKQAVESERVPQLLPQISLLVNLAAAQDNYSLQSASTTAAPTLHIQSLISEPSSPQHVALPTEYQPPAVHDQLVNLQQRELYAAPFSVSPQLTTVGTPQSLMVLLLVGSSNNVATLPATAVGSSLQQVI